MKIRLLSSDEANRSLYAKGINHVWISLYGNPLAIIVCLSDIRGDKLDKIAKTFCNDAYIDGGVSPNDKPLFIHMMHYIS